MFSVGPTFFSSGGVLNASNTGFLNHMDVEYGGSAGLVSTYGSNMAYAGGAVRSTTESKFGGISLATGTGYGSAGGLVLAKGTKAWRLEGWYKSSNSFGNLITIRSSGSGRQILMSANGGGGTWSYNISSLRGSGGGALFGATATVPPNNSWYHFAVQQTASSYIYFFCNGQIVGALGTNFGVHFNDGDLDIIDIAPSAAFSGYVDEVLYRNFTGATEEALLYPVGNGFSTPYTIPTEPFA